MKVLDTDTCIGVLRGRADVMARRAQDPDEVVTTWVTAAELFFGAARSQSPTANALVVERFLRTLRVLAPDLGSARIFGELKATLHAQGQPIADADLFIGAITLAQGATLVTGSRRHFDRLPGLVLEDWLRP